MNLKFELIKLETGLKFEDNNSNLNKLKTFSEILFTLVTFFINVGSNIFTFNLINLFSKVLQEKKDYNTLFHLYLSYIKKDFLDVVLPNDSFLNKYFDILEFYVIGFINR